MTPKVLKSAQVRHTDLHADAALQVDQTSEFAALLFWKMNARLLKIMLQGVTHSQSLWCVSICCHATLPSPIFSSCSVMLV